MRADYMEVRPREPWQLAEMGRITFDDVGHVDPARETDSGVRVSDDRGERGICAVEFMSQTPQFPLVFEGECIPASDEVPEFAQIGTDAHFVLRLADVVQVDA